MNIRQALLKTAYQIEREPESFNFMNSLVTCGSPMCVIGWVSYFKNGHRQNGRFVHSLSLELLGVSHFVFYDRLNDLKKPGRSWCEDAPFTAQLLRRYVQVYHPLPVVDLPKVVTSMFDCEVA